MSVTVTSANPSNGVTISNIINDVYTEGPETLNISLSNSTGGTLGAQVISTLTINDNDNVPGAANPIDDHSFFIRQHYLDFLNRQPDGPGLQGWLTSEL